MNRSPNLEGVFRAALLGLEALFDGIRARVVPQGYHLIHHLDTCGLEANFILIEGEDDKVLRRAQDSGQTIMESSGIDPARIHCCVVPFHGGCLYLDSKEPFAPEVSTAARMVTHQLVANLSGSGFSLQKSERDPLNSLPDETWFTNQLHQVESPNFAIISVELDSYESFKEQRGWEAANSALRELASFLAQRAVASDALARCQAGEFLLMTRLSDKTKLTKRWLEALTEFESLGIAKTYNLTVSAGIAIFPEDGTPISVKELAQSACVRAAKLGCRLLAVASPSFTALRTSEDPSKRFDTRTKAIVSAAVEECQVRRRPVDPAAIIWGFCQKERELCKLLWMCGLDRSVFRERLESMDQTEIAFSNSAMLVFGASLEFASRNGRKSIGISHLLLACLADSKLEEILRQCGLNYGQLMAGLYREGHFSGTETLLVGDYGKAYSGVSPVVRPLPRKAPKKFLQIAFGKNFTAEVWALLADAKKEASDNQHDLEFAHLYVALLKTEGAGASTARACLLRMAFALVKPEQATTNPDVIQFFCDLDEMFSEVTVENFGQELLKRPEIWNFKRRLEGL